MAAPGGVTAQALDESHVLLSWTEVPGAFKYYVFRAEGAGPMDYVTTVVAPDTTFVVGGLTASTAYSFTLQAEQWETSPSSDPATATTYAPGLNYVQTPANAVAAGLDESRIQLTWDAIPNAAKYYVFQAEGANPVQFVGTVTAPETTWIATGLSASTQYSFALGTAMADGYESTGSSTPVTGSTLAAGQTSVQPPANVAATPLSEDRISLSWDAVPGASKYYLFRAQGADPLVYMGTVEAPETTTISTGLAASTQYSFAVATGMPDGRDSNGYSTPISATTFAAGQNNVQTPASVTATAASESRIDVTWASVSGAAKYYVFFAQGADPLAYVGTVLAPDTSYSFFGLAASTQYSFAIATGMPDGMDSTGTSAPASATTFAPGVNNVPVPASVTATASSDTRIDVSWSAVAGAQTYYVFRAEGAGPFAYVASVSAPDTTTLSVGLQPGTQYSFAIGTAMPDGRESSSMSTAATATTLAAPQNNAATPANVTATADSDSRILLSWDAVPSAAGYYVFRAEGAAPLQYIGTVSAPATELLSTGLTAGTQYSFAVATVMPDGTESAGMSSPVSASTLGATVAPAPTGLTAAAVSDSRIELAWSAVAGAVKYYVMRSDAGGPFTYVTSIVDPTTAYDAADLAAETQYAFEIIAVMADGTESAASAAATATTLAAPAP